MSLREIHARSKVYTTKVTSYFPVYEALFAPYRNRPIVFVEVGVLHGGSLFMWREYFGPSARIIGIDLSPHAKRWEKEGFEIYIGDQNSEEFWRDFFSEVGQVDILLDDGGHTNLNIIATVCAALPHVRDGGLILVEDVTTSYMSQFGNPSKRSFINFAKAMIDAINSRSGHLELRAKIVSNTVYSMSFFESMVAMHIDRTRCVRSFVISSGTETGAIDVRSDASTPRTQRLMRNLLPNARGGKLSVYASKLFTPLRVLRANRIARMENLKTARYFRALNRKSTSD